MTRAVILVPAPGFHEAWDWAFDVEADALRRGGIEIESRPWTDPGDLSGFDAVLPLVAWGYHLDPSRWHALLDLLEREGPPMLNPVPLLRWNSDKTYLTGLGSLGVSVIPTRLIEALDQAALDDARHAFGETLIIKPPVSAAADGTHKIGPADPIPADSLDKAMLIQPFLPSIADEGEISVMLFDGLFSHSIVKRPKAGDFRVQPHLGGTEAKCDPPAGAIDLASSALAAAPAEAAYARVDMVRGQDGRLAVIELELIEPALWLQHSPDGGASFADAIRRRIA